MGTKLRIRVNPSSLIQGATLVANAVVLASNAYRFGTALSNNYKVQRQARREELLETTASVVNAAAQMTSMLGQTWKQYHET